MLMIKKYFDIKLLIIAVLSALIHSFAITNFSIPAHLYPAGFSGISRIVTDVLFDFFSIEISYSIMYFVLNLFATVFVFNRLGKKFAIYSIIQFVSVSIFTLIFRQIIFIDDSILLTIFGGIINGFGVGLALAFNFSTGGFDFISIYFANKYKKDVWNYIFSVNVIILLIACFIYGWERPLNSIIFQFVSTSVIKSLHQRYKHKTLTIITKYPEEVSQNILKSIRHGITEIKATGFYSKNDETILYTVVNSFQYRDVVKATIDIDPKAFINVQSSDAIFGNYYQKPLD